MIKVEALIRPQKVGPVLNALSEIGIQGVTVTEVYGMGRQEGFVEQYRGLLSRSRLVQKIKLEIVVADDDASLVAGLIGKFARTGEVGDGKILLCPVDEVRRIRTGEVDEDAIA
jgi:nitrogen regulatory protein P-II 1